MIRRPPRSTRTDTLFPYTTLFRSDRIIGDLQRLFLAIVGDDGEDGAENLFLRDRIVGLDVREQRRLDEAAGFQSFGHAAAADQAIPVAFGAFDIRSEERRVGKERVMPFRSRWWP